MENQLINVIIIGSGPAGYTAAIYCGRALLEPLMITGNVYGGQLMTTTDIENFPGYVNGVAGPEMMKQLQDQAEKFGTNFVQADATSINKEEEYYIVKTDTGEKFCTKSIILATGAKSLWLNAEGEEELKSNGISTCAVCDGAFFKNEKLIVIGGGDSAMEEALFLTRYASKVTIIHRRDVFKASKVMLERAENNEKIEFKKFRIVKKWLTDSNGTLRGALLEDTRTVSHTEEIECGGAFIAIGHKPATEFLSNQIETDDEGYIILKEKTRTSLPGIFACGDVTDKVYKQAIYASGMGCAAALDCIEYLESNNNK